MIIDMIDYVVITITKIIVKNEKKKKIFNIVFPLILC